MNKNITFLILLLLINVGIALSSPSTRIQTFTYQSQKAFETNYPDYWFSEPLFQDKHYIMKFYEYARAIQIYTEGYLTVGFSTISLAVFDVFTVEIWNITSNPNLVGWFDLGTPSITFNASSGTYYGYCFLFHVKADAPEQVGGQIKLEVTFQV